MNNLMLFLISDELGFVSYEEKNLIWHVAYIKDQNSNRSAGNIEKKMKTIG